MRKVYPLFLLAILPTPTAAQTAARDSVSYDLVPPSRLEVRTGKAGLLGFAGHDHVIRARSFSGRIVFYPDQLTASHVTVSVPTDSLEVITPPDTAEIRKVTAAMREDVLDAAHFPEITLTGRAVERAGDTVRVDAILTMKGQSQNVPLIVGAGLGADTVRATTTFTVNQTDFGIRPYRGGPGGTVRVADRVTFIIEAIAVRRQ